MASAFAPSSSLVSDADPVAPRVAFLNRQLVKAWDRGLAVRPDLAVVRRRAARLARREDRGSGGETAWREGLGALVSSLKHEADLNPVGETFAYVQLNRHLAQRERARRLWRAHPEIAQVPLPRPIIILGQMRSGTTRLQRLLGCDRRLNATRFFEINNPVAPALDWRRVESWAQLKMLDALNPANAVVHPTRATAVEEAFGLFAFGFYGAQFEAQWRVPSFTRFWEGRDRAGVYREFRHLLQTIAWQRRAPAAPFVLKAPQFMEDLSALLSVFPDARLITIARDPAESTASTASLVWNQMRVQCDRVDQAGIGAEWSRKVLRREEACARDLAAHPGIPRLAVDFAAMNSDWRAEMRRVYRFLDMPLTPAVEGAMARDLAAARASGYHRHQYRPQQFGLDPERIRGAMLTARAA